MKWLDTFRPKTVTYEEDRNGTIVVVLVQAQRVGRLQRQILYRRAVAAGITGKAAVRYYLANKDEVPKCDTFTNAMPVVV